MFRFVCLNSFIAIYSIILCLIGLIVSIFDRNGRIIHRYCAVPWAKAILFVCGVKVNVKGIENIDKEKPSIFLSNHQSYFDVFTLIAGLQVDFKFILKQELMRIPLLGIAMSRAGYISIDRSNSRNAVKSINRAAEKIKAGTSVLIFPEGTRSEDGHVQSFKKGGFHLALKSGCDLVPLGIINSRHIVPKGSLNINKGMITLVIGKPITVKGYSRKDMDGLIEKARKAIIDLISKGDVAAV